MPLNTFTVACSVTPTAIRTFVLHFLASEEKRARHPAKRQLSYHEGINLLRQFLEHASHHRVEDLQAFTAGPIPVPQWVHVTVSAIPKESIDKAADLLITYLGPSGIKQIGGQKWWQWRATELKGEWVEMRSHFQARNKTRASVPRRTLLYVHGGAYYFGSVDVERYQIQRHARKMNCRAFAPKYRLAPQYPFPCAVLDVLASYLYLLEACQIPPEEILVSGDSAGGALVLGILCLLRDVGIPLPAGGILISPWVDLLHSFPSIMQENDDYIPNYGFHHRPSLVWPPPTSEEKQYLRMSWAAESQKRFSLTDTLVSEIERRPVESKLVEEQSGMGSSRNEKSLQGLEPPSIEIDGNICELKDQTQMIAPNNILSHPLLSPITQGSLGGLCPLLIIAGGGELLRDEIIYVAHKAAEPSKYPTSNIHLRKYPKQRDNIDRYTGTNVFLQVFDGCAHATPVLSFTRPAKYMYRSIANFGIWCTTPPSAQNSQTFATKASSIHSISAPKVKVTGSIPEFDDNMIRQRISTHGVIRQMEPAHEIRALNTSPDRICVPHAGPVKRWLIARQKWDIRYTKTKNRVQLARVQEHIETQKRGFLGGNLADESPPPSALALRPSVEMTTGKNNDTETRKRKNLAGWMWGMMAGQEDREREN